MKRCLALFAVCLLFLGGCADSDSSSSNTPANFYFTADSPTHYPALWKSDGTKAQTQIVKTFQTPPKKFLKIGDKILFVADYPHSVVGVWLSDGTKDGTFVLAGPFIEISDLIEINGNVYFLAQNFTAQSELWKISLFNNESTLVMVSAIGDFFADLRRNGNNLMFSNHNSATKDIWISDGTAEGTRIFASAQNQSENIGWASSLIPGKVFLFRSSYNSSLVLEASLWITDGTEAGNTLLKMVSGDGDGIWLLEDFSDKLIFLIIEQGQLSYWGVDKSSAVVEKFFDVPPGPSAWIGEIAKVERHWYFVVDKIFTSQKELWVSDGSQLGTRLLKTFIDTGVGQLAGAEEGVLFTVYPSGDPLAPPPPQLWTSDGTEAGTRLITEITAEKPCVTEELLHFDGTNFYFLYSNVFFWKTDGTADGTVLVKNLAAPE